MKGVGCGSTSKLPSPWQRHWRPCDVLTLTIYIIHIGKMNQYKYGIADTTIHHHQDFSEALF